MDTSQDAWFDCMGGEVYPYYAMLRRAGGRVQVHSDVNVYNVHRAPEMKWSTSIVADWSYDSEYQQLTFYRADKTVIHRWVGMRPIKPPILEL